MTLRRLFSLFNLVMENLVFCRIQSLSCIDRGLSLDFLYLLLSRRCLPQQLLALCFSFILGKLLFPGFDLLLLELFILLELCLLV